ncbi:MAG TPA: DUF6457 domain-containing protein [Acidimicrobiales bacterium]|nr:DUF6457 domain-containing protein [Acidimicrobiales bacterium]
MTGQEWIAAFATRLGVAPPDDETVQTLLAIAGVAAHASERTAAPIACFLIGHAGITASDAASVAATIGQE